MHKSCIISFRLCEEDKNKLQSLANDNEKDLSNYILDIIKNTLVDSMEVHDEKR